MGACGASCVRVGHGRHAPLCEGAAEKVMDMEGPDVESTRESDRGQGRDTRAVLATGKPSRHRVRGVSRTSLTALCGAGARSTSRPRGDNLIGEQETRCSTCAWRRWARRCAILRRAAAAAEGHGRPVGNARNAANGARHDGALFGHRLLRPWRRRMIGTRDAVDELRAGCQRCAPRARRPVLDGIKMVAVLEETRGGSPIALRRRCVGVRGS